MQVLESQDGGDVGQAGACEVVVVLAVVAMLLRGILIVVASVVGEIDVIKLLVDADDGSSQAVC
jgi:hypothetical protein